MSSMNTEEENLFTAINENNIEKIKTIISSNGKLNVNVKNSEKVCFIFLNYLNNIIYSKTIYLILFFFFSLFDKKIILEHII